MCVYDEGMLSFLFSSFLFAGEESFVPGTWVGGGGEADIRRAASAVLTILSFVLVSEFQINPFLK